MPSEKILRRFEVAYDGHRQLVDAAYWQSGNDTGSTPDGLIRFKDTDHKPVFAVRADLVETITELRDVQPRVTGGTLMFACTCTGSPNLPNPSCPFHGSPLGGPLSVMAVTL